MSTEIDLPAIQRGDTVPYILTFTDGVSPIDMRGKTLVMTFKLAAVIEDDAATLTKSVVIAANDTGALSGIVSFRLEKSETLLLIATVRYHYAVRIIQTDSPENIETTYFYGRILVEDA